MSALTPTRRAIRRRRPSQLALTSGPSASRPVAARSTAPGAAAATLGRRLDGLWTELSAGAGAECPLCGDEMRLGPGVGRCGSCGTELS